MINSVGCHCLPVEVSSLTCLTSLAQLYHLLCKIFKIKGEVMCKFADISLYVVEGPVLSRCGIIHVDPRNFIVPRTLGHLPSMVLSQGIPIPFMVL